MISQNQLLLIEVGAESELMFKESGRQTNEITFFFFFLTMREHLIKGAKEGVCVCGGGVWRRKGFTRSFSGSQKSATRALLSRTKAPRPIHKSKRESENNKRTREKEKHEQDKALTGKETAQSAALTRAGTHLRLAQAPAGEYFARPWAPSPRNTQRFKERNEM